MLETPETVTDMVRKSKKITGYPDISFDNVMFRYGDDLSLVLDDVSFKVSPGETVALVGHSGAGKSTCANLLLRFWDVNEGSVSIGGGRRQRNETDRS